MNVLLTGASGFVGSHILDHLRTADIPVRLLLRTSSDTTFIRDHLPHAETVRASFEDPAALRRALAGITHVIHCAGATKALTPAGLYTANQLATRHLVTAANDAGSVTRFILVSSLAAGGPGTRRNPRQEDAPPEPVSEYGRSKLAGELEVRSGCRMDSVILRPSAVYGPRDREFLALFRAARAGFSPRFGGGRQELSLVAAPDLAAVVVLALTAPGVAGLTLNVAGSEAVTAAELASFVASLSGRRTLPLPLPLAALGVVCGLASAWARLSGRATILAHGKVGELRAPGWVADVTRLRSALGPVCLTPLTDGLAATGRWYREAGWL